jgi:hypothetical protein
MTQDALILISQNAINQSNLNAIVVSQGDSPTLGLVAMANGSPFNLTGATFTTFITEPNGSGVYSIPNSQHTANADQVNNTGFFIIALQAADTESLGLGPNKEILTEAVISGNTYYFHGLGILTVLPNVPLQ